MTVKRLAALAALACSGLLNAQLDVQLRVPSLLPGMERLETMLAEYAADFTDDISGMAEDSFDKPLFMRAFSRASAASALVAGAIHRPGLAYASLGSVASVYSDPLTIEAFAGLGQLTPADDRATGGSLEPLQLRVGLPLGFLSFRGLDAGLSAGFMSAEAGAYGCWSASAGVLAGWTPFKPSGGVLAWDSFRLELGANWALNRLTASVSPGPITQTVPIDPDGPIGPLVPINVVLAIDPEVRAGVGTEALGAHLQASTGITLLKAVSLSVGAGVDFVRAGSGISISADAPIEVRGYLSSLIEEDGRIILTGVVAERELLEFGAYLLGSLSFRVGRFSIGVPLAFRLPKALGAGLFIGINW